MSQQPQGSLLLVVLAKSQMVPGSSGCLITAVFSPAVLSVFMTLAVARM